MTVIITEYDFILQIKPTCYLDLIDSALTWISPLMVSNKLYAALKVSLKLYDLNEYNEYEF